MAKQESSPVLRRAFLSQFSAARALFAAPQPARPLPKQSAGLARHPQDEWLDDAPQKHRVIFDTWMADKFADAVAFAGNWARVNKEQYGLTDADLALVIVARHGTTPFAFNEAIWRKYGKIFAANMSANDKTTHPNPATNLYASRLTNLTNQGMRLAVCNLTLRAYTQIIEEETGAEQDAIHKELTANAIGNAQFVPAGIVAVTRAQEHGYTLLTRIIHEGADFGRDTKASAWYKAVARRAFSHDGGF
jgi:intracellular sulfur oxidation DsrE/DsrF family protein